MTTIDSSTTDSRSGDNGVNVQALLDAREVLKGAPEAAQFTLSPMRSVTFFQRARSLSMILDSSSGVE